MILEEPLQTKRLTLREFQDEDFPALRKHGADPEVHRFVFGPWDEDGTRRFMESCIEEQTSERRERYFFVLLLKSENRIIGDCGLWIKEHRSANLSYMLNRQYWGRGYATEAGRALLELGFARLNLHRIFATCDERNIGSWRVMEKLGMRREGHLIEDVWQKERWRSSYLYAILEREWKKGSPCL